MDNRRARAAAFSLTGLAVCLILAPVLFAAGPTAYATPASIAAKIRGGTPQLSNTNTGAPTSIASTVCSGLGTAHAGTYNTFRCKAIGGGKPFVVWARALPGAKFCASSTGLASCPPGPPVSGDPRICSNPISPPAADPNRCSLTATELGLIRAMKVTFASPAWTVRNLACTGENLSYVCEFSSEAAYGVYYKSTIKYKHTATAWTATIRSNTVGQKGGGNTCTVSPPKTPAGKPSNWNAGPAPVCVN